MFPERAAVSPGSGQSPGSASVPDGNSSVLGLRSQTSGLHPHPGEMK